jgi:phage terminase small subunit
MYSIAKNTGECLKQMTKHENSTSKPPRYLRSTSRKWWENVVKTYDLEEHHLKLLTAACECLDRADEARLAIDKDGAYFVNRHGERKPHPALQVERDSKALFSRLLRELDLDVDLPVAASRPPVLRRYGNA